MTKGVPTKLLGSKYNRNGLPHSGTKRIENPNPTYMLSQYRTHESKVLPAKKPMPRRTKGMNPTAWVRLPRSQAAEKTEEATPPTLAAIMSFTSPTFVGSRVEEFWEGDVGLGGIVSKFSFIYGTRVQESPF